MRCSIPAIYPRRFRKGDRAQTFTRGFRFECPAAVFALFLSLGWVEGNPKPIPGAVVFTNGVHRIRIEISADGLAQLRRNSRQYIRATVREGNEIYPEVGIHLKGSTGSFRSIDDKPSFT